MTATATTGADEGVELASTPELRRARRRLLAQTLGPCRGAIVAASACVVLSTTGVLAMPYLVKRAIDDGLVRRNRHALAGALILFAVAALTDAVAQRVALRLVGRTAERSVYDLRLRLWTHVQGLSIEWFERQKTGRIVSRATTDIEAVYELFSQAALTVVSSLLVMAGIGVILVLLDPVLGVVVLAVIPVLALVTRIFKGRSEVAYRRVRERIAVVLVHLAESLTGMRVVQAYAREPVNQSQFEDVNVSHLAANSQTVRLMSIYGPGVDFLGQVAIALVLLVGGIRAGDGRITVGVLAAFLLYLRQFFDPLQELSQFYNSLQAANAGLEKLAGVLQATSSVREPKGGTDLRVASGTALVLGSSGAAGARIRFEHVSFAYRTDRVLHDVSLTIEPGETLALVGATGAGKSTLAKLVPRFYDPTDGAVLIDGHDLRTVATRSLRAVVAVVPQEAFLFSGTVHDNIALARPGVTRADVEAAARAVGADDFVVALPAGYDTPVDRRGARLSGGQRQLISFARAWVSDPRVLILDEATSSLDLPSERLIQRALRDLLADRTAIVIAHRLSSIDIADRIAVVESGRIVEAGRPADLLAGDTRYRALRDRWEAAVLA